MSTKSQSAAQPKKESTPDTEITKNALKRMLHRAGVQRVSATVYNELRALIGVKLEEIMQAVIDMTLLSRRKTIQEKDIQDAAKDLGHILVFGINKKAHTKQLFRATGSGNPTKTTRKHKPGAVALKKIKALQSAHGLLIPKQNFKRLTIAISRDIASDLRYQKDVISLVQLWVEDYIVEICHFAYLASIHAGRGTLFPKDIQLVRRIRKEQGC